MNSVTSPTTPVIASSMNESGRPLRRAVIIGGSFTGMTAAKVLSEHFDSVLIIERDQVSEQRELRRGVPQSAQPHGLQLRGRAELNKLFPGYVDEVKAAGGNEIDLGSEMARFTPWGWAPTHSVDAHGLLASRPLMETTIRRLLARDCPDVQWLKGVRVRDLCFEHVDGVPKVTGVRTDASDEALREIDAELVIDATGRGSKAPRWFEQMGLPKAEEIRVDSHSNYATRHYRRPEAASGWWWKAMMVDAVTPDNPAACSLFSVEDDTWIVTAMGMDGQYAPTDEEGWLKFIGGLRSPAIAEVLERAEPLTDVMQSRTTHNIWRQMHSWQGEVDGLLLLGDSVCGFNPLYGQGVTSSAIASALLSDMLEKQRRKQGHSRVDRSFIKRFYRQQRPVLAQGWSYSTSFDYRWRGTTGKRPFMIDFQNWLGEQLSQITIHDAYLFRALAPLLDFGANPLSVLTPSFMARASIGLLRHLVARPRLPGARALPLQQSQAPDHKQLAMLPSATR